MLNLTTNGKAQYIMHNTYKYLGLIPKLTSSKKNLLIDSELWFRHL